MELVFVDDGSTDGSVEAVRSLPQDGPAIRLVRLSRNFGSHAAIAAGASLARGELLSFLCADLQDPPEILVEMVQRWRDGSELVWATRDSRADPWSTRAFSHAYYVLLRRFALPQMPKGGVDFCLVDRRVVDSLGDLQERNSNVFNLLMWSGFSQSFIRYRREARRMGRSKWTFARKVKLFIDSFVAFSFVPMRLIASAGAVVSIAGLLYAAFIVVRKVFYGELITGWASLMVVVLLTSGIQLLILGILSEYLWRALDAARNRPLYLVREVSDVTAGVKSAARSVGD
jgi:dolichol-phosphate mannosyltransferase